MTPIFTPEMLAADQTPGPPPEEFLRFEAEVMESPSAEETILIARTGKASYPSAASFYRAALATETTGYVGSLCQPIDQATTMEHVRSSLAQLRDPFTLDLGSRFVAAMLMEDEPDAKAIFIETDRDYIVVYWDTTA